MADFTTFGSKKNEQTEKKWSVGPVKQGFLFSWPNNRLSLKTIFFHMSPQTNKRNNNIIDSPLAYLDRPLLMQHATLILSIIIAWSHEISKSF